jgi:hypothetical protein
MWKRTLVTIGLLSAACLTMEAQSQNEEGELNFSMGGGLSVPLNPVARFVGVGGSFLGGSGYNIDQHSSIVGQFQWDGLRPSVGAIAQLNGISQNVSLYGITADYKYRRGIGKTFGWYLIGGGGWYYRHASISKSTFVPTNTVCQPIWTWYGYTCSDGYVNTVGAATGTSSFGANAGIGLTIRVKNTGWKFFMESRYTYAMSRAIATQVAPVTFGFEYQ